MASAKRFGNPDPHNPINRIDPMGGDDEPDELPTPEPESDLEFDLTKVFFTSVVKIRYIKLCFHGMNKKQFQILINMESLLRKQRRFLWTMMGLMLRI